VITLKTLPTATAQEVFDHGAVHLLTQSEKSVSCYDEAADVLLDCRYRYGELRCAAGCFIGPGEYKISFEGNSWEALVIAGRVPAAHQGLITALQGIHDQTDVNTWYVNLRKLAESRNLSSNVLLPFKPED
jgi:hypothetical protein